MNRFGEPIFLGGLARSGKTQLRLVLDEIPGLSFTRRTKLWNRIFGRFGDLGDEANLDRCLEAMAGIGDLASFEPDLEALRTEFVVGPRTDERLICLFHEQVARRRGKTRWGDQMKEIERYGPIILDAVPGGRMIHMVRDPRRLRLARSPGFLRRHASVGAETARWIASMEAARVNRAEFGHRYLVVRYEDLAETPTDVVRTVCEFIGEDVPSSVPAVIDRIRFDPTGRADGDIAHAGARRPGGADGRGRPPSSADRFISRQAGHLLREHGYRAACEPMSPTQLARYAATWPAHRVSMAAWHILDRSTGP